MTKEKEIAEEMLRLVNSLAIKEDKIAKEMLNGHRTLQQSFTRLCLFWLYELSQVENYDLRNEASVKIAKKINETVDLYENANLPSI